MVSDWGATHSTVGSANGGLDLEMPDKQFFGDGLRKALNDGTVPMARLDDMVRRILRSMYDTGLFDSPQTGTWGLGEEDHGHGSGLLLLLLLLLRGYDVLTCLWMPGCDRRPEE